MQPFSMKTMELLVIAMLAYFTSFFITKHLAGLTAMVLSVIIFAAIYVPLFYVRNISPDVKQVMETVIKRFRKEKIS